MRESVVCNLCRERERKRERKRERESHCEQLGTGIYSQAALSLWEGYGMERRDVDGRLPYFLIVN